MRKFLKTFSLALSVSFFFMSCMSTRVYTNETSKFYDDNILVAEKVSSSRDGKVLESSTKNYLNTTMDGLKIVAERTISTKEATDVLNIKVFKNGELYAQKDFRENNGVLVNENSSAVSAASSDSDSSSESAGSDSEKSEILAKAYAGIKEMENAAPSLEETSSSIKMVSSYESVTVESVPNKSYIVYNILGKPFVLLGSTSWSLLKCCGYALINFAGGYNAVTGGDVYWKMPDVKASKEKAAEARAANGISAYPEYHLPFTNNHITVQKVSSETENVFNPLKQEVKVLAEETTEYDNTISVERSVSADANSTAATVGLVGTVVTVPVSVVTWVGGAVAGVYGQMQN